ncbi:MAG: exodeoxyribonuclease VII small subunit [Bacilli bacterium]|nr:exodeoxyribonuclease VII small subunit [Bacilli bacterium]
MAEEKKSYEERLARLQEITSKIENEVLPLEETTALYQEGKRLCKELQEELEAAEKLVEETAKE